MPDADNIGLTVKELLLRLDGKLDAFIAAHEVRHGVETAASLLARGDADASPAGRSLTRRISEVSDDVNALAVLVRAHEAALQRLTGALALLTMLGLGTLTLVFLRMAGVVG